MTKTDLLWMKHSIALADNAKCDKVLRVGAVLTCNNEVIYAGCSDNSASWFQNLLSQISKKNEHIENLYLTINTMSKSGCFDLNKLLKMLNIDKIYIGVPDPKLSLLKSNDPVLILKNVNRYPDALQKVIIKQNLDFYLKSKQNISFSPYYAMTRISNLVLDKLKSKGFLISEKELELNKDVQSLVKFLVNKFEISFDNAKAIVNTTISEAFNEKYSSYDYRDDVRSISKNWINDFNDICKTVSGESIQNYDVLNVGVGSGEEAIDIFHDYKSITFVDIAEQGLEKIKERMPSVKTLCARAEDMSNILSNTFDLYISLRTYNSSFFNIKSAIAEAYRVLKHNGILIISVANSFLSQQQGVILSGLLVPNTDFIDVYRGVNLINELVDVASQQGFINLKTIPTETEIYITATANKERE